MASSDDEREARAAAQRAAASRPGSGSSLTQAQAHLEDKKNQRDTLVNIKKQSGSGALRGTISDGIKDVERDIANIEQRIPGLKPGS